MELSGNPGSPTNSAKITSREPVALVDFLHIYAKNPD
jgi:hypothetical protein